MGRYITWLHRLRRLFSIFLCFVTFLLGEHSTLEAANDPDKLASWGLGWPNIWTRSNLRERWSLKSFHYPSDNEIRPHLKLLKLVKWLPLTWRFSYWTLVRKYALTAFTQDTLNFKQLDLVSSFKHIYSFKRETPPARGRYLFPVDHGAVEEGEGADR